MAVHETIVDTISIENLKTIAGGPAWTTAQAQRASVAHENRVSVLAEAHLAAALNRSVSMDPIEAISLVKAGGTNLSDQGTLVAAIQQLMKGAQTTRPETGAG